MKIFQKSKGFTLIEVMVSVAVLALLSGLVASLVIYLISEPNKQRSYLDNTDQARFIANNFANELRNATTSNDGQYAINYANSSEIIFFTKKGASGLNVNKIRYYILEDTLYKGVTVPTGNPLSYGSSSETVTTLMTNLINSSSPIFYYYNGDYNGNSNPLELPANINNITYIKMSLTVPKYENESANHFSMEAGAAIRGLKTNLGD